MQLYSCLFIVATLLLPVEVKADTPKLDLNDVSWLWPVPRTNAELDSRIISMDSLKKTDGTPIWSDQQFDDFVSTAQGPAAAVNGSRIDFQTDFKSKKTWRIVAFRADPSAPGGHGDIRKEIGERPQLRLILQPITPDPGGDGTGFRVHDVTLHMVFTFLKSVPPAPGANAGTLTSNREKFSRIVAGLDGLKKMVDDAGVPTSGVPLGVHPGLKQNVPGLDAAVRDFLQTHLESDSLTAMALMGLQEPEPWVFLAMGKSATTGRFGPVAFLKAQMRSMRTRPPSVSPLPDVNNRNPINKTPASLVPATSRRGVGTAVLFMTPGLDMNAFANIGIDSTGTVLDTRLRNRDIPDLIANPNLAHFFNTDCVSCHSETRWRMDLSLAPGDFAFKIDGEVPAIDPGVLPKHKWNVRNFGWFRLSEVFGSIEPTVPTVTQRTANETADVVQFLERHYRVTDPSSEPVLVE